MQTRVLLQLLPIFAALVSAGPLGRKAPQREVSSIANES